MIMGSGGHAAPEPSSPAEAGDPVARSGGDYRMPRAQISLRNLRKLNCDAGHDNRKI
jgi:hypothetical protein